MDKFGVALALSFAGIIYARVRHKRIRPSDPPAPPDLSPNSGMQKSSSILIKRLLCIIVGFESVMYDNWFFFVRRRS